MDNQQSSNSPERLARRHTTDTNTQSIAPRYDFVLPSYSRDRRVSSTTTTVPAEIIIADGAAGVNIPIPEQNSSSLETANNQKGTYLE
jgi:hypothetical protein